MHVNKSRSLSPQILFTSRHGEPFKQFDDCHHKTQHKRTEQKKEENPTKPNQTKPGGCVNSTGASARSNASNPLSEGGGHHQFPHECRHHISPLASKVPPPRIEMFRPYWTLNSGAICFAVTFCAGSGQSRPKGHPSVVLWALRAVWLEMPMQTQMQNQKGKMIVNVNANAKARASAKANANPDVNADARENTFFFVFVFVFDLF